MILALRRDNYEILVRYRLTRDLLYWRRYLLWKYLWHLCLVKNLKTWYVLTSLANNRILAFDHSDWDPGKGTKWQYFDFIAIGVRWCFEWRTMTCYVTNTVVSTKHLALWNFLLQLLKKKLPVSVERASYETFFWENRGALSDTLVVPSFWLHFLFFSFFFLFILFKYVNLG